MVMAKTSPFEFVQQVRREAAKVTWPSRKETGVTTLMVFIMVAFASVFFALVDTVLQFGVGFLLGVGG
jgi:preprotein translocase subunit SecE